MKNRRTKQWERDRLEMFRQRCRDSGLKITPQRLIVYQALLRTDQHPAAEQIYRQVRRQMPNMSFDTVNRTLATLARIGAAFIVEGTGQPRRFDGGMEDHQHFRCLRCDKIFDFHHPPFDNIEEPKGLGKKFKILRKTVYLEGLCDKCIGLEK